MCPVSNVNDVPGPTFATNATGSPLSRGRQLGGHHHSNSNSSFPRKRCIVIPAKALHRHSRESGNPVSLRRTPLGPRFRGTTQIGMNRAHCLQMKPGTSFTGWLGHRATLDRQEHRRREGLDHPPYDPVRSLSGDLRHHVLVGDHLAELALEGKIARVACDLV
jgi:hypothetical protein